MHQDTICAISTPPGGAIGIVRLSGPLSIPVVDRLFYGKSGKSLTDAAGYTAHFGEIRMNDQVIDQVITTLFRAPHSYTGEDMVEISCHGSSFILQNLIETLLNSTNEIRLAQPGEFTKRAFLNGKMDLAQAEAVADLIAANSKAVHDIAIKQIKGEYSGELKKLREQLLKLTSLIELELDFSDHEDLEFANRTELKTLLNTIQKRLEQLVTSFKFGNAIKNGIPVAIIGNTNTGKSTLLNTLLREEKAITSNIQGTTRDVIDGTMTIRNILFRFIDTAGIRKTSDEIEKIGVKKSLDQIKQAEIVLWMLDANANLPSLNQQASKIIPLLKEKNVILIFNKEDLLTNATEKADLAAWASALPLQIKCLFISARKRWNIDQLEELLALQVQNKQNIESGIVITNARHYEALKKALDTVLHINKSLQTDLPIDLITIDLRTCITYLSQIMGEITSEEILQNIFSKFCIGK